MPLLPGFLASKTKHHHAGFFIDQEGWLIVMDDTLAVTKASLLTVHWRGNPS